jgi:hypothetical protein
MPRLTAKDTLAIAAQYHDLSVRLGKYRFASWEKLSAADRASIESVEWSLMGLSTEMTARGIELETEDLAGVVRHIRKVTLSLRQAVNRTAEVKQVIAAAGAGLELASAIAAGDVPAILEKAGALLEL